MSSEDPERPRGGRDRGDRDDLEPLIAPLLADGVLARIGDRDDDARQWLDCELCTFVEHRFDQVIDPAALTPAMREEWSRSAVATDEHLVDPRRESYRVAFWLLDEGERAGTVALSASMLGRSRLDVSSLYIVPGGRSRGIAYRALRRLHEAVVAAGHAGIRVATHWTWQAAVRRYLLRYRMWAWSFKRSIDFTWGAEFPRHTIVVEPQEARLSVEHDTGPLTLLTATHDGTWLTVTEDEDATARVGGEVRFYAWSTFALALAVHGWPLLGTPDEFAAAGGDIGGPPVLARKIAIFEWIDRKQGFAVHTPRIPGLPYDEIARELERPR